MQVKYFRMYDISESNIHNAASYPQEAASVCRTSIMKEIQRWISLLNVSLDHEGSMIFPISNDGNQSIRIFACFRDKRGYTEFEEVQYWLIGLKYQYMLMTTNNSWRWMGVPHNVRLLIESNIIVWVNYRNSLLSEPEYTDFVENRHPSFPTYTMLNKQYSWNPFPLLISFLWFSTIVILLALSEVHHSICPEGYTIHNIFPLCIIILREFL